MKEKIERNIDKDIERCKELIKIEHSNWIGMSNQDAISNVLSDRETWKKMAEKLAERVKKESFLDSNCYVGGLKICKGNKDCQQCILDWARKEVDKQ